MMQTVPAFREELFLQLAGGQPQDVVEGARTLLLEQSKTQNRGAFRIPSQRTPSVKAARAGAVASPLPDVRREVAIELLVESYYDALDAELSRRASAA